MKKGRIKETLFGKYLIILMKDRRRRRGGGWGSARNTRDWINGKRKTMDQNEKKLP